MQLPHRTIGSRLRNGLRKLSPARTRVAPALSCSLPAVRCPPAARSDLCPLPAPPCDAAPSAVRTRGPASSDSGAAGSTHRSAPASASSLPGSRATPNCARARLTRGSPCSALLSPRRLYYFCFSTPPLGSSGCRRASSSAAAQPPFSRAGSLSPTGRSDQKSPRPSERPRGPTACCWWLVRHCPHPRPRRGGTDLRRGRRPHGQRSRRILMLGRNYCCHDSDLRPFL
mmetsp:Transcript_17610/g.43986  ORF Transcript_17610/g.43986 Transcript_17610/m.43986 type:complete len:228 (+) Transcript_17610:2259-2942(+)